MALEADQARSPTGPGANDNATGVAAVLDVAARLAAERPPGLEVVVLICGCEESGMGGMAAWMLAEGRRLDPAAHAGARSRHGGLGGAGGARGEGPLRGPSGTATRTWRWPSGRRRAAGVPLRRWRLGGWTDPVLARLGGLPAISLLSVRDGGFPNYHRPSDTPENVDFASVEACAAAAAAIALEHAA